MMMMNYCTEKGRASIDMHYILRCKVAYRWRCFFGRNAVVKVVNQKRENCTSALGPNRRL